MGHIGSCQALRGGNRLSLLPASAITTAEVLCVLYRKEQNRALKRGGARRIYQKFRSDMTAGRILTIPFGRDVEIEAEKLVRRLFDQPRPVLVRSLDVIHVSTALTSKAREFVTTAARLREVGSLAGLNLLP